MNKISADGHIHTCVKLEKDLCFKINQDIDIVFSRSKRSGIIGDFIIKVKYREEKGSPVYDLDYLSRVIKKILQWISLCYEVPASLFSMSVEAVKNGKLSYAGGSVSSLFPFMKPVKGDKKLKIFQRETLKDIESPNLTLSTCLELFNRALNEKSNYSKFWYLYSIFQILISGEILKIDKYLQNNFKLLLMKSDFRKGRRVTVVTAMRDTFSHPEAAFGGKSLDLSQALSAYLPKIQKITKEVIKDKLNIDKNI